MPKSTGINNSTYYISWANQSKAHTFDIQSAKDDYYLLKDNTKVFDLCSTSYNACFGHSYRPIINRLKTQLESLCIPMPKCTFDLKKTVSKKLLDYLKVKDGKIFYTSNGSESIENALKMARQIKNKKIILAREDSYHGATLGALSVTGDWRNKEHFTIDDWTARIPTPLEDPELVETEKIIKRIGPENIAGFCLETITGGNGVILADQNWWDGISHLCQKYYLYLILDEVVCGFNRTGLNFGFMNYKINPDIVCMAKGITAGYIPFGALYTTKEISKFYDSHTLAAGLTNYAHPLGLCVLDTILDELQSNIILKNIKNLERVLSSNISHLKNLHTERNLHHI